MKIQYVKKKLTKRVCGLKTGDVFLVNHTPYMMTNSYHVGDRRTVNLINGMISMESGFNNIEVEVVEPTLVIE